MTQEGELYKKIEELRALKTTNITKKDTANTGPLDFSKKRFRRAIHPIALIEIEKVLDEAKKDIYANIPTATKITAKRITMTRESYELLWSTIKKWFGDANP
jgi:hypothetical protein